ncbi:phosphate signaling complex protein PhoU [Spirochaeta lutea]|uniref:phosphate signaling complex protein PhoU n=1 Tax=Spirochaeta lutea TaxID=1480694 RepID=UPI0006915E3E|nr:phosphate signaling complex protein PhoU [Spirochaeta lutea]
METRIRLNEQMAEVYQTVLKMGTFVEEALRKALNAVSNRNMNLAQQVIEHDIHIDSYQNAIEDMCTKIIATEQPVASDLRELVTLIKVVSDLERIGDHARHLAKSISSISEPILEQVLPKIKVMTEKGISMVHDALTALSTHDADLATTIAAMDDQIDELHTQLYEQIITIMQEDPRYIEEGTTLLFLNRFLERLGDHVTNICEWIVYAKRGTHIELNF